MQDRPVPITALPGDFVAPDDEGLFEFISSLRRSVRAKVVVGQQRGMSLADIVVDVREMVRFAEEDPNLPRPFPTQAYRAISREAVAWCIEAYQPIAFTAGHRFVADALVANPKSVLQLVNTTSDVAREASPQPPIK